MVVAGACKWQAAGQRSAAGQRFSRESSCNSSDIQVRELGAGGYRVSGCGRWATYSCFTSGGGGTFVGSSFSSSPAYGVSSAYGVPLTSPHFLGTSGFDLGGVLASPAVRTDFGSSGTGWTGPEVTCIREDGGREAGAGTRRTPVEPVVRFDQEQGVSVVQSDVEFAEYRLTLVAAGVTVCVTGILGTLSFTTNPPIGAELRVPLPIGFQPP